MSIEILERRFAEIGARVKVESTSSRAPRIDVRSDRRGEYFELRSSGGFEVVDVRRRDRHLLLLSRDGEEKSKFLCGMDERHWFVAAIPESARGVNGVDAAKDALQPDPVRQAASRLRKKERIRRRTSAYVRQGEWFFVPERRLRIDDSLALRNEPLTRGRGTPHVLAFAFYFGGRTVYVQVHNGKRLAVADYERLPRSKRRDFRPMTVDPELYAKGAVTHPDHATVVLNDWHRVLMNTEQGARAMRHVAFLD